jgi:hypothetical protein
LLLLLLLWGKRVWLLLLWDKRVWLLLLLLLLSFHAMGPFVYQCDCRTYRK